MKFHDYRVKCSDCGELWLRKATQPPKKCHQCGSESVETERLQNAE